MDSTVPTHPPNCCLFIGIHDASACQQLSQRVRAYFALLPPEQHQTVGKETGETAHQERWYNTLHQRLARFVRKTLSFSQSDLHLYWWTLGFILHHNQRVVLSLTLRPLPKIMQF